MRIGSARSCIAFLVLLCAALVAWGQVYTGSITGTVKDPSGASVPNANVTVTDVAKGYTYHAVTDASGVYTVRNLPPSTYTVRVEAPGFNPYERSDVTVAVNAGVEVNASLAVAAAGQTVTVTAQGATQLETQNATTGATITRREVNDLPLINRAVFDLAFLTPGVTQPTGTAYGPGNQANNFVSDGERNAQSDILIDGISTTSYDQNTGWVDPLYTPGVEAVQEFRVETSNFSAEIGFSAGTVVNVVTRSGTNQIHGDLFEFFRNMNLNANYFFNNADNIPKPSYHYNDFGGTIGGPIKKDRLFYFFDYEGSRTLTPSSITVGVPDAAERTGNFSELCGDKGGTFNGSGLCTQPSGQLWNPFSSTAGSTVNPYTGNTITDSSVGNPGGGVRTQYIPYNCLAATCTVNGRTVAGANLINPVSAKLINFFPLPNQGGVPGTPSYNAGANFYGVGANVNNNNQFDLKLDSRLTDMDQLSVRFSRDWTNSSIPNIFGNVFDAFTQGPTNHVAYSGAVNYTHTFNATTLLTGTAGYDHAFAGTAGVASQFPGFNFGAYGLPSNLGSSGFIAPPAIALDGYNQENGNAALGGQPYSGLIYAQDVYHFLGSIAKSAGNHDLHFGGEFRVHRINFTQYGLPAGRYEFQPQGTSEYQAVGGDALASFMIGDATGWNAYEIPASPATQNLQIAGFVQDNWHVNDRLTLNIGVRYDVDKPRTERFNQMSFFDLNAPPPLAGIGLPNGSVEYVGTNGYDRSEYQTYYGAIGPRFGFAYRIGQNWTVRGGYGIYYDPTNMGAAGTGSGAAGFQGYDQQTNWAGFTGTQNIVPATILGQAQSISPVQGNSQLQLTQLGNTLNGIPIREWNKVPSEQSWSFGIERQLPWNVMIDVEYVGRKGSNLYFGGDTYALNHIPANVAAAFRANPGAYNNVVPIPASLYNAVTSPQVAAITGYYANPIWSGTWPAYNQYLPYPEYPTIPAWGSTGLQNDTPPWANSIYNSGQFSATKRFSHGLQFLFSYVFQKSIDESSLAGSNVYINGYSGATLAGVQDPNNLKLERSVSQFNIPQVLQFSWIYHLPIGRGLMFGSNWNKFVDAFLGGWQLNGIYRWDDGFPLFLTLASGIPLPNYGTTQRPNYPYQLVYSGTASPNVNYFSNAPLTAAQLAAWIPAPYADGTAPRTLPNLRAPGTNTITASLFKQFDLGFREGARLEFRAEAFNVFNNVQFAAPSTQIGGSTPIGVITGQANQPRALQLALKLYF